MRRFLVGALFSMLIGCGHINITGLATQEPPSIPQQSEDVITIGTFNIQVFGKAKREKEDVMQTLENIARHYDILAIQEIRDASLETIPAYLERINNGTGTYAVVASERTGRTSSKEQYAFYYDDARVDYINVSYLYPDEDDVFERDPHIAYFRSGAFDFMLVNVHIKPDDAEREIAHLQNVITHIQDTHHEQDIILIGDLNADGSYYDETNRNLGYVWLVPNHYDTTVARSSNTYDRIIITGTAREDYHGITGVHRFDEAYSLSYDQTRDVSDHYPVWSQFSRNEDTD